MAKTRAQRKAERRAREAEEQKRSGSERRAESRAQHDTQVGVSGDIAEIEAVEAGIAAGADGADLETPAPARGPCTPEADAGGQGRGGAAGEAPLEPPEARGDL